MPETQSVPELWGAAEVLDVLGYSAMHLKRLRDSGSFPAPAASISHGKVPVWTADSVRGWIIEREQDPRRKRRLEALRVYRQTGSVTAAAKAVGAKRDSVYRWMADAGEPKPTERP